jgi:hypothetical protein
MNISHPHLQLTHNLNLRTRNEDTTNDFSLDNRELLSDDELVIEDEEDLGLDLSELQKEEELAKFNNELQAALLNASGFRKWNNRSKGYTGCGESTLRRKRANLRKGAVGTMKLDQFFRFHVWDPVMTTPSQNSIPHLISIIFQVTLPS